MVDSYIPAAAFYLLCASIMIVSLSLNMFLDRAFKMQFSKVTLAIISIVITYAFFIFSQTGYFSNLFDLVEPDVEWYPNNIVRAIVLTGLDFAASMLVIFLADDSKIWGLLLGTIFALSVAMFFSISHLLG